MILSRFWTLATASFVVLAASTASALAQGAPPAAAPMQQSAAAPTEQSAAAQVEQSTVPVMWAPPPGVIKLSDCAPYMGEHWANPQSLPTRPIYTVDAGRLVSVEFMIPQAAFAAGESWNDLKLLYMGQRLPFDHVNVDFLPEGHDGFEVPHYDMHFQLLNFAEDRAISCGYW